MCQKTYSKWYFLSFSWLTCTIWFEVTTFNGSERDAGVFCCFGVRFIILNFLGLLWWTAGCKFGECFGDSIDLDDLDPLLLPLRVRLALPSWVRFLEPSGNVSVKVCFWFFCLTKLPLITFRLGLRSLKLQKSNIMICILLRFPRVILSEWH